MGQMTRTALKDSSGTLLLQLQQGLPCKWHGYGGSQDKQSHEMSNEQSEKQSFPNTILNPLGKTSG